MLTPGGLPRFNFLAGGAINSHPAWIFSSESTLLSTNLLSGIKTSLKYGVVFVPNLGPVKD